MRKGVEQFCQIEKLSEDVVTLELAASPRVAFDQSHLNQILWNLCNGPAEKLPGHKNAGIHKDQAAGPGTVLAFEMVGGPDVAQRVTQAVRLMTHATSLGGVETLIERRRRWASENPLVPEALIRLSVGIEDVEDLWQDLEQALAVLG